MFIQVRPDRNTPKYHLKYFENITVNGCGNMFIIFSQNVPENARMTLFLTWKANVSNVLFFLYGDDTVDRYLSRTA